MKEYQAEITFSGTVRYSIEANNIEEAKAFAAEIFTSEETNLTIDSISDWQVTDCLEV